MGAPQNAPLQCAGALSLGVFRPSYQALACSEGMTWSGAVHTGQQLPSCFAVKGAWHSSSPHVTPLQKAGSFLSSWSAEAPRARLQRSAVALAMVRVFVRVMWPGWTKSWLGKTL